MEKNPFIGLITSTAKPSFFQSWIAGVIWALFKKLWDKLSEAHKRILAQEIAEKMVDEKMAPYRDFNAKLQEEIDQLKAAGQTMTPERKDEIRKEKVRLETDIWNAKP